MSGPAALIVPAVKRHTSTVIVAHGLGDSGAGWTFLSELWRQKNRFPETKFIFPNAPSIPITCHGKAASLARSLSHNLSDLSSLQNMGMRMPGWYDILSLDDIQQREDDTGIKRSQAYFNSLVAKEIEAGIPSERIVLGGFSQGAAMSLMVGITSPVKLGGIFGLSGYLLLKGKVRELVPKESPNKDTPIFMGHGDVDQVVRYVWGQQTAAVLQEWGWNVEFKTYKGLAHSAAPQEIDDLERYISSRIPDLGDKESL